MRQLFLESRALHIFPCRADKRPCTPHGHHDAVSDAPSIAELWERYPGPLVGVATGATGGIDVLDIDPNGENWFHAHRDQLPQTRTHKTRREGLHLINRHATGLRCSTSKIAPGVDIKADGGYVIWWPAALGRVVCDGPFADFPVWVADAVNGEKCTRLGSEIPSNPHRGHSFPLVPSPPTRNLPRRIDRILRIVETATPGTRNDRLYWAACRFAEIVAEGRLKPSVAAQLLSSAAWLCGLTRDDGQRAAASTIASGLRSRKLMTAAPALQSNDLESIADELVACRADPERFVDTMFDWKNEPELKGKAPEQWQREVLRAIRDGLPLSKAIRIAVASGHGVGKTALVSWIVLWAMSTCTDCRGILTASNEAQLATRNRAELRKWFRLFRGRVFFDLTATALISSDPAHEQTWRLDLLPWNPHRPEAFAGLHNQGRRVLVIMDEASSIEPIIWQTIEPVMTDINTEIIWCAFGNALHNTGPFRECFGRFAHRWQRWHIDARTVGIADQEQIKAWAEDHAEDSYFFMTRVRGQFPTASALQFISTDLVEAAMTREIVFNPREPMVLGVDVARFGDDCSVIYPRRGLDARSILPMVYQGISTDRLEDKILEFCSQQRVEVIFIDGGGIGGAVVDHLRRHNLPVEDIQFGGRADRGDQIKYANKRAEMWGLLRDGLRYLAIPPSNELRDQLISPEFDYNLRGEIQLERKSDMKKRGLASPDIADALALTYARPVFPRDDIDWLNTKPAEAIHEYNPFDNEHIWEEENEAR